MKINTFLKIANAILVQEVVTVQANLVRVRMRKVGCLKLDDTNFSKDKCAEIFNQSNLRSSTIVNMEVLCCFGLLQLVKEALNNTYE